MSDQQDLAAIMKQRKEQKEGNKLKNKSTIKVSKKNNTIKKKESKPKSNVKKPTSSITVSSKQLDEFIEKQLEQDELIKELMKKKKDDEKMYKIAKMAMKAIYGSSYNRYKSAQATGLLTNLEILKEFFDITIDIKKKKKVRGKSMSVDKENQSG